MTRPAPTDANVASLDSETRSLVRLSAVVTAGSETQLRAVIAEAVGVVRPSWVEEVILQSYLFGGFPRALNAMREWRRASGELAPVEDETAGIEHAAAWERDGERTCAAVYGRFYERLRDNIRDLHPALDAWMVVDGYGKVLSRPELDLRRRELCIVASCALGRQDRQLHSHLHGALHVGAHPEELTAVLEALDDLLPAPDLRRYHELLAKVVRQ